MVTQLKLKKKYENVFSSRCRTLYKKYFKRRLGVRFLIYNPNVIIDNQRILKDQWKFKKKGFDSCDRT